MSISFNCPLNRRPVYVLCVVGRLLCHCYIALSNSDDDSKITRLVDQGVGLDTRACKIDSLSACEK